MDAADGCQPARQLVVLAGVLPARDRRTAQGQHCQHRIDPGRQGSARKDALRADKARPRGAHAQYVGGNDAARAPSATHAYRLRQGILKLLSVKDSDIRLLTLEQCRDAVDNGLHAGGAFSATIPLVALYYGGFIDCDVVNPTRRGQDLFVLSKGHAVAALASIYAELGYFDRSVL